MKREYSSASYLAILLLILLSARPLCAAPESFPVYPAIQPNIAFWKDIFAKYRTSDGVIHDSEDLRIIYDVIKLLEPEAPNAHKINRVRSNRAVEKYRKILIKLSKGVGPSTEDERRVAAVLGPEAKRRDYKKASHRVRCQTGLRDRFQKSIIRSGAYMDVIKEIFRSHSLPEDLAYLPHVESSFNLRAYSRAGAAGIWQFTTSTGKRLMEVGYTVDERWDPVRSSQAAARLLKESKRILGEWPLALTAYNHGTSGMMRAKRAKGDYETIFREYRSRSFKFASRNFYSEFLAACEVAKNYQDYFGDLPLERPLKYREVVLKGYVDVRDLAEYLKMDISLIRALNPSLRSPVYRGEKYIPKGYALRLPEKSLQGKAAQIDGLPEHLHKPQQKRTRFYSVQRGDTAGKIARIHGVRVKDLVLANNLDDRALIYAGQNLRIPTKGEILQAAAEVQPASSKEAKAVLSRTIADKTGLAAGESAGGTTGKPVLMTGIINSAEALRVNPGVVIGDFLVEEVALQRGTAIGIIRVEVEETLGHYADWLGVTTGEIRRLNGFSSRKMIRINDRLKIPFKNISKEAFEEKRFEYHKEIQDDFFASYRVKDLEVYQIKTGDNIWNLCQGVFEVPLWLLVKYNPTLNIHELNPSKTLVVPLVEEIGET